MKQSAFFWLISVSALTLGACTQEPAQIVYKGDEFFGREHEGTLGAKDNSETFDEDSPRYKHGYARPVTDAAVTNVAVSDLPPPNNSVQSSDLAPPASTGKQQQSNLQPHFLNDSNAHSSNSVQAQDIQEKPAPAHETVSDTGNSKFIWPVDGGKIIAHFKSGASGNDGINVALGEGEPIFAVADGTVVYAGNELAGYGNMVIIRHANGFMSAYAHARSISIKKGDKVKQSDLIAYVGSTGSVKSPQLHFVLRKDKTPVDPEKYLPKAG